MMIAPAAPVSNLRDAFDAAERYRGRDTTDGCRAAVQPNHDGGGEQEQGG